MKEALIIFMVLLLLMLIISVFGGSIRYTNRAATAPMHFPRYEPFYADAVASAAKMPVYPASPAAMKEEKEKFADKEDAKAALSSIVDKIKGASSAAIEPFEASGEFAAF
jgi:hypothetical protein